MRKLTVYFKSDGTKDFKTTENFKNTGRHEVVDTVNMAVSNRRGKDVKSEVLKVMWGHEQIAYTEPKREEARAEKKEESKSDSN